MLLAASRAWKGGPAWQKKGWAFARRHVAGGAVERCDGVLTSELVCEQYRDAPKRGWRVWCGGELGGRCDGEGEVGRGAQQEGAARQRGQQKRRSALAGQRQDGGKTVAAGSSLALPSIIHQRIPFTNDPHAGRRDLLPLALLRRRRRSWWRRWLVVVVLMNGA